MDGEAEQQQQQRVRSVSSLKNSLVSLLGTERRAAAAALAAVGGRIALASGVASGPLSRCQRAAYGGQPAVAIAATTPRHADG